MLLWTNLDEFVTTQHFISSAITGYLHILIVPTDWVKERLNKMGHTQAKIKFGAEKFKFQKIWGKMRLNEIFAPNNV